MGKLSVPGGASLLWVIPTKGQIKPKAVWMRRRFSQKQTNGFVLFAVKSKKANQPNSFIHFLAKSTVCQSAVGFIWPLHTTKGNINGNLWFVYNHQFYIQKHKIRKIGYFQVPWNCIVTSNLSHWAMHCVYWSWITNVSWNSIEL